MPSGEKWIINRKFQVLENWSRSQFAQILDSKIHEQVWIKLKTFLPNYFQWPISCSVNCNAASSFFFTCFNPLWPHHFLQSKPIVTVDLRFTRIMMMRINKSRRPDDTALQRCRNTIGMQKCRPRFRRLLRTILFSHCLSYFLSLYVTSHPSNWPASTGPFFSTR